MLTTKWIAIALVMVAMVSGCATTSGLKKKSTHAELLAGDADRAFSIARLTERRGDLPQAKELYQQLIEKEQETALAMQRLGVISAREGKLAEAIGYFESAAAEGNESVDLKLDNGYAMLLQGDLNRAEELFVTALQQEPKNKRALNNMAILRGAQGRFPDSLAYSKRAVGSAKGHANVGYLVTQFGDVADAADEYHQALADDPDLRIAAHALLQLEPAAPLTPGDSSTTEARLVQYCEPLAVPQDGVTDTAEPIANEPMYLDTKAIQPRKLVTLSKTIGPNSTVVNADSKPAPNFSVAIDVESFQPLLLPITHSDSSTR